MALLKKIQTNKPTQKKPKTSNSIYTKKLHANPRTSQCNFSKYLWFSPFHDIWNHEKISRHTPAAANLIKVRPQTKKLQRTLLKEEAKVKQPSCGNVLINKM